MQLTESVVETLCSVKPQQLHGVLFLLSFPMINTIIRPLWPVDLALCWDPLLVFTLHVVQPFNINNSMQLLLLLHHSLSEILKTFSAYIVIVLYIGKYTETDRERICVSTCGFNVQYDMGFWSHVDEIWAVDSVASKSCFHLLDACDS